MTFSSLFLSFSRLEFKFDSFLRLSLRDRDTLNTRYNIQW